MPYVSSARYGKGQCPRPQGLARRQHRHPVRHRDDRLLPARGRHRLLLHARRQQRRRRHRLHQEHHLHHGQAAPRHPARAVRLHPRQPLHPKVQPHPRRQRPRHHQALEPHGRRRQAAPHSFIKDAGETRNVEVRASRRDGIAVTSSIAGLSVLKSTGSAFHGFVRDEYTTLPETWDRILATDVDARWNWKVFPDLRAVERSIPKFDRAFEAARNITLKLFAEDNSASVQNTMYKMCEQILEAVPEVDNVAYALPNNHNFELDLTWHKGLKNTGEDAEVYVPQSNPNGLIKCEVSRDGRNPNIVRAKI
ncbi:hypothetical protein ACCO45_008802 [Purpureocillium lilacinum]|uniref:Uncharacterized protein n=1 Tax=Purpureocillium lilacinum TaxID=33203 RepID=A0ACC4DI80_PURLI